MKPLTLRRCLLPLALPALFLLAAPRPAAAQTLVETFDDTEIPASWSASGFFTNATNGLAWTYTWARSKQIQSGNPALGLRGGTTASQRGTLTLMTKLTNGIGRVSFTVMRDSSATNQPVRLDLLADGVPFATCEPAIAYLETVRLDFPATSAPLQAVSTLCISNRGLTCAIDDLEIEPFRLFVSVAGPENGDLPLGRETEIEASLWYASGEVSFEWSIEPDFAGYANDWNDPHLTLIPAEEDLGKTFTLTARLRETADPAVFAEASCELTVSDSMNPRFLDFEDVPTVNYDTNAGAIVAMRGVNWRWFNVRTSDTRDAKIGTRSARFLHTSQAVPAILESQDPFEGVGAVTLHCACFQDNGPVDFVLEVCGDGEDWSEAGTFSTRDCHDITNCVAVVTVDRIDPVCVRIRSTAGSGQIADIDDIRILPYGESPPILAADIPSIATLGSTATAFFTLLHADGIVREWSGTLDPPSEAAAFEVTPEDDYLFTFAPTSTNDWGCYALAVSADLADGSTYRTQATLRVVSAPAFELAGTSSVTVTGVVDVVVTNVVLHGTNTEWKTAWTPDPPFANDPSLSNKSRYRIAKGTTETDIGEHILAAVLTDEETTAAATNYFPILVLAPPLPPDPGETYVIASYTLTNLTLRASNSVPRSFTPFALASPAATNWIWSGPPRTSAGPANLDFDLTGCTNPAAVFGVLISGADE